MALLLVALVVVLGILSVDALRPPDTVPADVSPAVFSAGRATG